MQKKIKKIWKFEKNILSLSIIKKNMAIEKLNSNSSFWLGKDFFKASKSSESSSSIQRNLKLLSYKRSISNFVKLLTKKDIKVSFSAGNQSYTDGKCVVISSKINENNFDVTVGLALHEAAHVLLTDFKIRNNYNSILADELGKHFLDFKSSDNDYIHTLHNIVEDRYIDEYVYTNAPGYRGYYNSLYDYYFRKPSIAIWLTLPKKRTETFENYKDQLLNIINPGFDVNCMPGMPALVKELDLPNIMRLATTEDRLRLAIRLYVIIKEHVLNPAKVVNVAPKLPTNNNKVSAPKQPKQESESDILEDPNLDSATTSSIDNEESEEEQDDTVATSEPESNVEDEQPKSDPNVPEQEDIDEPEVQEDLELINKFLRGTLNSGENNNSLENKINALDTSNAKELLSYVNLPNGERLAVKGLLIQNVSENVLDADLFPSFFNHWKYKRHRDGAARIGSTDALEVAINNGLLLGQQLAKKIMVRNEEKTYVTNRLNSGKIFNRHVSLLGADVENIFYKTKTDKFKKSIIHISVDASGSMAGPSFNNAIQMAVAVAKACTYLRDVNCIINLRGQDGNAPCTVIIYNSKVDHISKINRIFPYLSCSSSTPEGLCYDMYSKFISENDNDNTDKYLINLSDGEPSFHLKGCQYSYGWGIGVEHSRNAWNRIISTGVIGLSYFITMANMEDVKVENTTFGKIYGKDSKFIDPNSIPQLARTINDMLVSREAMTVL